MNATGSSLYIACGLVSIVYGAYVFKLRSDSRRQMGQTSRIETP
jgi:hypothetical protein